MIFVYENWSEPKPKLIGKMYVDYVKGKENIAFEYADSWLEDSEKNLLLDPDLFLYRGRQYTPMDKAIFGVFSDSCPDRWGRLLIKRKEVLKAKKEGRKPKTLTETDFLLSVYDKSRMGALRYTTEEGGVFLANDEKLATPPWIDLRELEAAARGFEQDDEYKNEKWLQLLIAPGSSLGGARPKATVKAPDGSLWIAKFPSKNDTTDSGAWEMVVNTLASLCEIEVPDIKIEKFSKMGSTFLVKRFDREDDQRIHFSSAMTLLGKKDGAEDVSYLDLVSFIKANGEEPRKDLLELWKRIVFNMAITNTDDHLRNHGFLLTKKGWRLSPVYDINPSPYGDRLSLNITENDNSISKELLLDTSEYYGINREKGKNIIDEISNTVLNNWQRIANEYKISRSAQEQMKTAFMFCNE